MKLICEFNLILTFHCLYHYCYSYNSLIILVRSYPIGLAFCQHRCMNLFLLSFPSLIMLLSQREQKMALWNGWISSWILPHKITLPWIVFPACLFSHHWFSAYCRTNLMKLRSDYKDAFVEKHGVKLGLMSGFIKVNNVLSIIIQIISEIYFWSNIHGFIFLVSSVKYLRLLSVVSRISLL